MYCYLFHIAGVIVLINDTPFFKFTRTFNYPVLYVFVIVTTLVANEFICFVVFVFATGNSLNFISKHPKGCFSTTFVTISVCIKWFVEPNSRLQAEGFIR